MFGPMLILLLIFIFIMAVPCIGTVILGSRLMDRLGRYPSKTPAIQVNTIAKLVALEIISFGMLTMLYHVLSDYGQG